MPKRILIISYNKVPFEGAIVEGTGLRYWRIARALKEKGQTVSIAVKLENAPPTTQIDGIDILTYQLGTTDFRELFGGYSAVIYPFAFGQLSVEIMRAIPKETQSICDAYSPYYLEALTKSSDEQADGKILESYLDNILSCNEVIVGSDYALIANDNQRSYYEGLIGGLGATQKYDYHRLIELPAYIETPKIRPIQRHDDEQRLSVLWFGGMYPWFSSEGLIRIFSDERVAKKAKLVVHGAWNPMYRKDDRRFNGEYIRFKKAADKLDLTGKTVFFSEWCPYDERVKVFDAADVAISVNQIGPETKYSFRLRVADMAGNGLPLITNGGDPLSELLIQKGGAIRYDFDKADPDEFMQIMDDASWIVGARDTLEELVNNQEITIGGHIDLLCQTIEAGETPRHNAIQRTLLNDIEDARANSESNKMLLREKKQLAENAESLKKDLEMYKQACEEAQHNYDQLRSNLKHPYRLILKQVNRRKK